MFAKHIELGLWLRRWFGNRRDEAGVQPTTATAPALTASEPDGPLFSLGDTKQDVVVSYRPAQAEKS